MRRSEIQENRLYKENNGHSFRYVYRDLGEQVVYLCIYSLTEATDHACPCADKTFVRSCSGIASKEEQDKYAAVIAESIKLTDAKQAKEAQERSDQYRKLGDVCKETVVRGLTVEELEEELQKRKVS